MKRLAYFALFLSITLFKVSIAVAAPSLPIAPVSALFYPNEVYLTVEGKLTPQDIPGHGRGLKVVLPPQASRETFSVTVDDVPANSFYWLEQKGRAKDSLRKNRVGNVTVYSVPTLEQEKDPARREMLAAIASLQEEADKIEASLQSTETRIALWQGTRPKEKDLSPDQLILLDTAFSQHLPELLELRAKGTRSSQEIQSRLKHKEEELAEYDESQVQQIAIIPFEGPAENAVLARYSYTMPGSCQTAYRLTAYPATGILAIDQDALLHQTSGVAWKDVDIFISTTRRDTALRPSAFTPWLISHATKDEAPGVPAARAYSLMNQAATVSERSVDMKMLSRDEPAAEEKGTFRLWSLGKRTLDSNVTVNLPLAKEQYKARYYYTLQPSLNAKGFLTADLSLDKALELPLGKARFFVDNVAIGEQPLSINGNKATLFFGTDPQVTATMRDVKRSSGEQGFISKEQTLSWHWEITVRNTRSRSIDVAVQDPVPDAQDTAIKINLESKPKPEITTTTAQLGQAKVYSWSFSLQPGEVKVINHKVQVNAPADKQITPGRQR